MHHLEGEAAGELVVRVSQLDQHSLCTGTSVAGVDVSARGGLF